jgi:hypothetical protein
MKAENGNNLLQAVVVLSTKDLFTNETWFLYRISRMENNGKCATYSEASSIVCGSVFVCLHLVLHFYLPTLRLGQSH